MARPRRRPRSRRCRPMPGCCSRVARPRCRPTRAVSRSPDLPVRSMSVQDANSLQAAVEPPAEEPITPRGDLKDAACWIAFGVAVLVGSITMDRLEQQHINPYTVPGLL